MESPASSAWSALANACEKRVAPSLRLTEFGGRKWVTLGQSYGGFLTLANLSTFPEGVAASFTCGGIPHVPASAAEVYAHTFPRMAAKTRAYYEHYPEDETRVSLVADRLAAGDVLLPDGSPFSVRRLQLVGGGLGMKPAPERLHALFDVAAAIIVTSMLDGFPHILKTYQLNRLIVFVDPSVDPTNNGYNLQQAKIAVGSGGLLGKGIGSATQAGNGFLPEAQTDFVFALLAEEFGFVGGLVLLGLFAWMILSTILLGMRCESMFGKLVCVGCAAMWTFQVLEEVGMCMGIMPITGIPLPFISYGATSMIAQLMAVGMVQSVWRHRQKSA